MTGTKGHDAYFDYTHLHFSGFGDNAKKEWSDELLCAFGVEKEKMARIVSPFEVIGKTTRAFAALSGTVEGIPVVAGCGDTAASTFGSGMFERDLVLDCAGTASVLCSVVNDFVPDTQYETMTMMRSPVDGLWLPLAYINGGGMCIRWFRDTLSGSPAATYDVLEAEAAPLPAGSEGLLFLPHFSGRVLPNNPDLKGSFLGLDFKHTRGHMYRSIMEAISYEYCYYLNVLRTLYPGSDFSRMLSIGGGANSPLFNKIKADALGIRVETFETGETALIGSAVIAGIGAGALSDYRKPIQGIMKKKLSFAPDQSRHAHYQPYAAAYLAAMEHATAFYKSNPFAI